MAKEKGREIMKEVEAKGKLRRRLRMVEKEEGEAKDEEFSGSSKEDRLLV